MMEQRKGRLKGIIILLIGLVVIYFAAYGIANQTYKNQLDEFEDEKQALISALEDTDARSQIFPALVYLQRHGLPSEPRWWSPYSVFQALTGEKKPLGQEKAKEIANIIVSFKDNLNGVDLSMVNLEGAILTKANLKDANLEGANLKGADLSEANLEGTNLTHVHLLGAVLGHAQLKGANLKGANLFGADLSEANLNAVSLSGAILDRARLRRAILLSAFLEGAYLREADFEGADFSKANLKDADLSGADFREVEGLTCDQLTKAKNWETVTRDIDLSCHAVDPNLNHTITGGGGSSVDDG